MKRSNPDRSRERSLAGVRALVGRARHQAGALSAELQRYGAQTIEIPFIEIRKPRSFRRLDGALEKLNTYDWLIFTSVNGVEAMWERWKEIGKRRHGSRVAKSSNAHPILVDEGRLRVAAIGPATKKALEQRGFKVDVVPTEYVAESVVRSLKSRVRGKRVLLVRAKVARDVIPRELRRAGAHVDVVEAYETVVPPSSRRRLQAVLNNPKQRPHVVTFTSSSTVRNFVVLLNSRPAAQKQSTLSGRGRPRHTNLDGVRLASIGPITSSTLRELGLTVDIAAKEFTIPGLVAAIVRSFGSPTN